jgi:hypothetical protein
MRVKIQKKEKNTKMRWEFWIHTLALKVILAGKMPTSFEN